MGKITKAYMVKENLKNKSDGFTREFHIEFTREYGEASVKVKYMEDIEPYILGVYVISAGAECYCDEILKDYVPDQDAVIFSKVLNSDEKMTRQRYRVYGFKGREQAASYLPSASMDLGNDCSIRILNSDVTGSHNYCDLIITAETARKCRDLMDDEIHNGFFKGVPVGKILKIGSYWFDK